MTTTITIAEAIDQRIQCLGIEWVEGRILAVTQIDEHEHGGYRVRARGVDGIYNIKAEGPNEVLAMDAGEWAQLKAETER